MLGTRYQCARRFLVRDEEAQFEKARKLIKREVAAGSSILVNQLVLLETEWVLRSRYSLAKNLIIQAISGLLDASDVRFEDEPAVEEALFIWNILSRRFRRLSYRGQEPTAWMSSDRDLRYEGFQVAGVYNCLTIIRRPWLLRVCWRRFWPAPSSATCCPSKNSLRVQNIPHGPSHGRTHTGRRVSGN